MTVEATAKSSTSSKSTKKSKPTHPKTSEMVTAAISNLKERGGSSLQAIKKYIVGTYTVDVDRLAPFIKKYIKSAVEQGEIIRTKGKGASGSFKLGSLKPKKTPSTTKKIVEKPTAPKKPKTPKTVKAAKAAPAKKTVVKTNPSKKTTSKVKEVVTKKAVKSPAAKKSPTKKASKTQKPTMPKAPKPKKAKKPVKTAGK